MSKCIAAAVAALALSIGLSGIASAGEKAEYKREYCEETKQYWQLKKVVICKTVIGYETKTIEVVKYVTEYDHCHKPYQMKKVFHKTIEVPVKKQIAVVKWVKVRVDY